MATICVTFICDFLKNSIVQKRKSSVALKDYNKSTLKKLKKTTNRKSSLGEQADDLLFIEKSLTVIHNVNKPVKYLHIEYNLLPKFVYKIDVVFWGTVAKVIFYFLTIYLCLIIDFYNTYILFYCQYRVQTFWVIREEYFYLTNKKIRLLNFCRD